MSGWTLFFPENLRGMGVKRVFYSQGEHIHVLWTDHCESGGNTRTRMNCYSLVFSESRLVQAQLKLDGDEGCM